MGVNVYLPAGVGDLATGLTDCRKEKSARQFIKKSSIPTKRIEVSCWLTVQTDNFSHCGGCFEAKKSGEGNQNPNNKHGGLEWSGVSLKVHARRKGAGRRGKYLKNGRNGRGDVEGKTKSTRNVVEEERLCCTGGELHC